MSTSSPDNDSKRPRGENTKGSTSGHQVEPTGDEAARPQDPEQLAVQQEQRTGRKPDAPSEAERQRSKAPEIDTEQGRSDRTSTG